MTEPIQLYSAEIDADPFPAYRRLRDEFPCYWSEDAGIWFLSRYDDVANAAVDWQTYSSLSGNLIDEIPGRSGGTLGTTDPPRHDRLRRLANHAFARKNLGEVIDHAEAVADRAAADCAVRTEFDFVSSFSSRVTVDTILYMLGLPPRDPAEIRSKVVLAISTDKASKGRSRQMNDAFSEISDYLKEAVATRRREPADDLITKLAEAKIDGDALSEREIVLTTAMFVVAGVESLSSFMSIFALNLAQMPDVQDALRRNPDFIKPAIEESLRYNTSAQRFKRVLTRDVDLHGQRMRKDDFVVLAYGSANRDERKFPDADIYDLQRNPSGHLGFGTGKHFCIGNDFARMVMERSMGVFLQKMPEFSLSEDRFDWVPSSNFRSPVTLPLGR